jgi:heat shock protein HslJ
MKMRRIMVAIAILMVVTTAVVGCGNSQQTASLGGTSWKLVAWSISSQTPADFVITAKFDDTNISGKSAINSYSGTYTIDGDKISFGPLMSTEMAGPENEMKAESNYLQLLDQTKRFRLETGKLTFTDDAGMELLIFEPAI